MVILAVDYGDVRTGVAVCDREELLAHPVGTVVERSPEKLAQRLAALCAEYGAGEIVMGLPKNMDGSEGFRAEACRAFGAQLEQAAGVPVVFRDERLTTVSAHTYLNMTDTRGKKRKERVDALSAVLILEDHLAVRKREQR